jgi:outer membrane murein-binding lipoprotein Lpp
MITNLQQINRQRDRLDQELSAVRRNSLQASRNEDFRAVARLTIEAARLNKSIMEMEVQAELIR